MEFGLTQEQEQLREEVRRFAENEIKPVAGEYDREEKYPAELVEQAADLGLTGAHFPIEYGGVGYSTLEMALVTEELFAVDPGIALCITSAGFGAEAIMEFGTEAQKEEYLPPITEGEAVMGAAISEPHAGSDVSSISTTAEKREARSASERSDAELRSADRSSGQSPREDGAAAEKDGDEWVLNGSKMWITNGSVGDYFVVMCETDPDVGDRYTGFSQIIVERDRDGFESEKISGKLGIRASDTAELRFDDVRVPEENLVGQRGMGFPQLMQFFDETRTMVAAQAVGIATGAAERALAYAEEREQFGRPISEFQAIRHKLSEMHTRTEAARQLTYKSAWSVEHAEDDLTMLASMAKEFASDVATDAADEAVQIHGGAGFVDDFDVERLYRDSKITQIYEGTTEIQKNIVARELLGEGY